MHVLQITELKQLFDADDAFIAFGIEKFHHDDLLLDVAGKLVIRIKQAQRLSK